MDDIMYAIYQVQTDFALEVWFSIYITPLSRNPGSAPDEVNQFDDHKVRKKAKIRNRYDQAPHLAQDTNEKWQRHN